jgi:hypothetical protein
LGLTLTRFTRGSDPDGNWKCGNGGFLVNGMNRWRLLPILAMLAASCGGTELNDENTAEATLAVSADGPFASVAALQGYWTAQPGSACLNVYVNGHRVYTHSGIGPCYEPEYFQCDNAGTLQAHCNSLMAGASTKNELIAQMGNNPNNPTVYLDGTLYQTGVNGIGYIATCYGDPSFLGHIRYYVATSFCYGNNGACFAPIPPTLGGCY